MKGQRGEGIQFWVIGLEGKWEGEGMSGRRMADDRTV
jgi:hypothetical protein